MITEIKELLPKKKKKSIYDKLLRLDTNTYLNYLYRKIYNTF